MNFKSYTCPSMYVYYPQLPNSDKSLCYINFYTNKENHIPQLYLTQLCNQQKKSVIVKASKLTSLLYT